MMDNYGNEVPCSEQVAQLLARIAELEAQLAGASPEPVVKRT